MTHFEIYLITKLDTFSNMAQVITIFSFVITSLLFIAPLIVIAPLIDSSVVAEKLKKARRIGLTIFIIAFLIAAFIPTTKEAAVIYCVPKIVNNEKVKELPDTFLDLTKTWMETQTKELKGKHE